MLVSLKSEPSEPQFIAETSKDGVGCALALSFQPARFLPPTQVGNTSDQGTEFYFVVDRSGSMAGRNSTGKKKTSL